MAPSLSLSQLPPFAPFPPSSVRSQLAQNDWDDLLDSCVTLSRAYLSLTETQDLTRAESVSAFLISLVSEIAEKGPSQTLGFSQTARALLHWTSLLLGRCLESPKTPPPELTRWQVLADAARVYTKTRLFGPLAALFATHPSLLEKSLSPLKKSLIMQLDAGIKTDLSALERTLARLNYLLHASPDAAAFFLAGSDFFDGLITCYRITNPPLRKVLVATAYLCLVGLTEDGPLTDGGKGKGKEKKPRWGMLTDSLFDLATAAESHRVGPLNPNDSLVPDLVSVTPLLAVVSKRAEEAGAMTPTLRARVEALQKFKKLGVGVSRPRAKRRARPRAVDKGKGRDDGAEMHVHRMSQIALVQDLFPDLGSAFVAKLLDASEDDPEVVIAKLLEDALPPHLANADRGEQLAPSSGPGTQPFHHDMAPRPTPPPRPRPTATHALPARRNVFDDDDLAEDMSNLHFGKRNPEKTADDVLADRSTAPKTAAILSALAAFDSDDDERDDTYDADDVGGAVDTAAGEDDALAAEEAEGRAHEDALFGAWQADAKLFDRDAATRRSAGRARLREETGMTDEAIEGWAVMLGRNPRLRRKLESRFTLFRGEQTELASTAWRARAEGEEEEEGEGEGGASSSSMRGGRGPGRGRGRGRGRGGRGGGDVAGPAGDKDTQLARRRKEANKGSRANHNQRDQRARKMARGGFVG
ncbi:hypothetical protein SODALDRAFT_311108 [Sodiomyces alkalinus F11]|uniref:CUE domain-containing protein n=1 Tax=Sodiomyces alkalinus (strain CBS 110278 / VKM F-3762 / F11) TaxID=1314773 RepID=A0A3N2PV79_SODAK|nr:hypothetical protein SODALDRAFT_311108 [Sodiomyces alkalinus F11]ROT38412.1 hypothetical protein SODALDRAFT_311108 [Sodiomyces alkalinus F11]